MGGMFYGRRHTAERKRGGADDTASPRSRHLAPSAFISLICDPIVVETGVCGALPNMLIGGINPFKCGTHLNTPFRCRTGGLKQYVAII